MGVLRHVSSGRAVALSPHTVAGRAPTCAVRLAETPASNNHASVFWTGERWEIRDLGSMNGTSVNEVTVPLQKNVHLALGAVVRFGCDAERWELTDDSGPVAMARSVTTGEIRRAEDGLLALPDPGNILASILLDSGGTWLLETAEGARRPALDREQITILGDRWELSIPSSAAVAGTQQVKPAPHLATLTLRFHVSRDEEHVRLDALHDEVVLAFGERASFYPLLLLARERLENAADAGLPESEHGWLHVDDLMKALSIDERHLNVTVHRIREAFGKAGVVGAEGIVQRRPKQVRIGIGNLEELKA
ncbi:MAG: FHA domain-containing protein [Byssovorax sp.]